MARGRMCQRPSAKCMSDGTGGIAISDSANFFTQQFNKYCIIE
jgi:hypothetical protein